MFPYIENHLKKRGGGRNESTKFINLSLFSLIVIYYLMFYLVFLQNSYISSVFAYSSEQSQRSERLSSKCKFLENMPNK